MLYSSHLSALVSRAGRLFLLEWSSGAILLVPAFYFVWSLQCAVLLTAFDVAGFLSGGIGVLSLLFHVHSCTLAVVIMGSA